MSGGRRPVGRRRRTLGALVAVAAGTACSGGGTPIPRGAAIYQRFCQSCHGAHGEGVRGMQPPLAGTPVPLGPAGDMLGWVMYGRRPPVLPRGVYNGVMPQFAFLTDADLADLLSYVRGSFGNHAAPVTVEMVAAARAAHPGG